MTRAELIQCLANRQEHLSFQDVEAAVKSLLENMREGLAHPILHNSTRTD